MNHSAPGTLYVVATPIGNLEDISQRAVRILREVALIACEDTRHTRKLLSHLGISTPLVSYYRENEATRTEHLLEKLTDGDDIALVSDAGTPAISDPGAVLVAQVRLANIPIIPVPGPSALTAAVSAAGLTGSSFCFGGFPPAKPGERKSFLRDFGSLPFPLVLYESPHRIRTCLKDCIKILGDRHALLFRELTKLHEQHYQGTLSEIAGQMGERVRGEIVLIVLPAVRKHTQKPDNLAELLTWYKKQPGMSLRDAVRNIATDLDLPRNKVYQEALSVWKDND